MLNKKAALLVSIAFLLSSCFSKNIDSSFQFTSASKEGLLAIGDSGFTHEYFNSETTVHLRKVDIANEEFIGRAILLRTGMSALAMKSEGLEHYRMFSLEPGKYAVVASESFIDIGYTRRIKRACYTRNVPVFEISFGTISVIGTGKKNVTVSAIDTEIFKNNMRKYSGITAEIKPANRVAVINTKTYDCRTRIQTVDNFTLVEQIKPTH